jgi:lipoprotein-anchoring transpeptidase ErfK/SrfK
MPASMATKRPQTRYAGADTIPMMRRLTTTLATVIVVTACGGAGQAGDPAPATAPPTTARPEYVNTATFAPPPAPEPARRAPQLSTETVGEGKSLAVKARGEIEVYRFPGATKPFVTLPPDTILGTVTVLSVIDGPRNGWAQVLLPVRPNGTTGWVNVVESPVYVVSGRIVVDLSERTLRYYEDGEVVVKTEVGVGSVTNPTPTGSFFVTDSVTLSNPYSPWGPHAFGLSARSETITEYNGGDGIIGIHGTNMPTSIGEAISLGCVRVPNDVITRLHGMVKVGTPVDIVA